MDPLTAERDTTSRKGKIYVLPVAAGAKIYAGGLVAKNAAGNAVAASDAAGLVVYGRAEGSVDNTAGQAGDAIVEVSAGCFSYAGSGFAAGDVGQFVFVVNDQTVAKSGVSHGITAGIIKEVVAADEVFIEVDPSLEALRLAQKAYIASLGDFYEPAATVAAVASADAPTQGETYAQADVQAIATLANELKTKLNAALAALKATGMMGS
ncbi:MAG TPA: hypothetical protein PLL10_06175 [Elusimicrobiales bacterium]|nr:hypothetical protein [Elusimicrobiales bacterium]